MSARFEEEQKPEKLCAVVVALQHGLLHLHVVDGPISLHVLRDDVLLVVGAVSLEVEYFS